jgi:prepilin-type processing-associated H-X9-DG protein
MVGGCGRGKDVRGVYQSPFAFAQHASDARHGGQINLVYADWHTVSVESLSRPTVELGELPENTLD